MKPEPYDKMMDDKAMDEGAKEKIKNYAAKWFDKGREYGKAPITKDMLIELEEEGEGLLPNLGYPKLPKDKPPLLSNEEIERLYSKRAMFPMDWCEAQREVCIKHYEAEI